jgi:hypothetical protein
MHDSHWHTTRCPGERQANQHCHHYHYMAASHFCQQRSTTTTTTDHQDGTRAAQGAKLCAHKVCPLLFFFSFFFLIMVNTDSNVPSTSFNIDEHPVADMIQRAIDHRWHRWHHTLARSKRCLIRTRDGGLGVRGTPTMFFFLFFWLLHLLQI